MTALPITPDPEDRGHVDRGAHSGPAAVPDFEQEGVDQRWLASQLPAADALLLIYADSLDDFERVRQATDNRIRALRDVKGLAGTPEEERLVAMSRGVAALEHQAELELRRAMRTHPLGPWVKATIGVGLKQGARLLASIGDPYWHSRDDRPRTVSELWAYCGYHVLHPGHSRTESQSIPAGVEPFRPVHDMHDLHKVLDGPGPSDAGDQRRFDPQSSSVLGIAPRRACGQRANWNASAKSRAFLVAESCIKQSRSPYRLVYDAARAKYADATHAFPCARCGPAGHPAGPGSALSLGHQHARGLRAVAKAVLKDLWAESRRLHEASA